MKRQFAGLLAAFLIIALSSCGTIKGDPSQRDNVELNLISVKKSSSTAVTLGNSPQQIINSMGTVFNSYSEYWEMQEKKALVYDYNGAKFKFLDNMLESFELSNSIYLVGSNSVGNYFSVGSNLSEVSGYLPNWASKKNDGTLTGNVTKGGQLTDKFIYIEFTPSTEKIVKISIRTY